jgi:hypothetical protein
MESSKTYETVIENEYCDILPNQVSMEQVSLIETMEKKLEVCKHNLVPFRVKKRYLKRIYKNCICKKKNGDDMIGMHYVSHLSL